MHLHRDDTTLTVIGPLDGRCTAEVRAEVYARLDGDLVVDLTECDWVDAAALRMLLVATIEAHRRGHHLVLECTPGMRRFLLTSRRRDLLEVAPPRPRTPVDDEVPLAEAL
ncbi:STAS domain-containing protein [Alteromonas gracilis]